MFELRCFLESPEKVSYELYVWYYGEFDHTPDQIMSGHIRIRN